MVTFGFHALSCGIHFLYTPASPMRTESFIAAACHPAAVRLEAAPPQSAAQRPMVDELESVPELADRVPCPAAEVPVVPAGFVVVFEWVTETNAESAWKATAEAAGLTPGDAETVPGPRIASAASAAPADPSE